MNRQRDRLDDAIDAVAARLTRVDEDDALRARIIDALPARSLLCGWLFQSWAPRLAMIALVVAAGFLWATRGPEATQGVSPLASSQPMTTPIPLMAAIGEAGLNRTLPFEPLEPLEPLELTADFERSLPAIELPAALVLLPLSSDALQASDGLVLEPLALPDLPLTGEPISPR